MNKIILEIYNITKRYPNEEQGFTGMVSQLRRASISAISNLAEGSSRKDREFLHFLSLSLGSLREVETQLEVSKDLGYVDSVTYERINEQIDECIGRLFNYMKKISKSVDK